MGVGGALLIVGGITGLAARRADRRFIDGCPEVDACDPSLGKHQDDAKRLGWITNVLWVSGAAFVVGGVVWKVTAPSPVSNAGQARSLMVTMTARY